MNTKKNLSRVLQLFKNNATQHTIFEEVEDARQLKLKIKTLEKQYKATTDRIKIFMKDEEELINERGIILVTYKNGTRKNIDTKKLREEEKEIYAKYLTEIKTRTFLIK